jgi:alkylation response protein AidB-like acyl-CoA dehydrogenase
MYVDLNPEQVAFRDELREYFEGMMTAELQDELRGSEGGGPLYRQALKQMGRDKLLGVGWPEEYGGRGLGSVEQFIYSDEVQRAGYPLPFLTLNTVGPTLMHYGTEDQRKEFLPRILAGEIHFAIGYSEPSAGTDLASLQMRAVRDGDDWVLNGQKTFTSLADYADYIWLAARTNPDVKKHRGISIFIVPTTSPGFKCTPIHTMSGVRTNATYYEDVRIPAEYLVGGENQGWSLITNQLNHERVSLVNVGPCERIYDEVCAWARNAKRADGSRVIDLPWVQLNLARFKANVEVLRLMNHKQAWAMTRGSLHMADSSAVKVFGSEFYVQGYNLLLEVMGAAGTLKTGSPEAVLQGRVEMRYLSSLILTFGGGTNEVQRDIIAMAGLQLPHYKS